MANDGADPGTECLVGVDVGGSALKLGVMAPNSDVIAEDSVPLASGMTSDQVLDALVGAIRSLCGGRRIIGLGLGLPGALDRAKGAIYMSPNLPWLQDLPIRDELAARLELDHRTIHLENDANVAAVGEQAMGGGAGIGDMLFVTLGTGIGSGLVLDGRLCVGAGLACEAGHICVDPDGPRCGCGNRGCVETLASASAAERRATDVGLPSERPGDLKLLTEIARAGDGPERELLHAVGRDLGRGLAAVIVIVDVRTIVFGGGFSNALDVLTPAIEEGMAERLFPVRPVSLVRAELGNRAGWIGAALLASGVD